MKRKNSISLLIIAIFGFMLMSGGCGGSSDGNPSDPGDIFGGTWEIVSGTYSKGIAPVQNYVKDDDSDDPITVEITENANSSYTLKLSGPDVKYQKKIWHREGYWTTVPYPNGFVSVFFSDGSGSFLGTSNDNIYGDTGFTAVTDNKLSKGNENDDNKYDPDGIITYEVNGSACKYTNISYSGGVWTVITINFEKAR